jgi:cobalamin synthase
MLPEGNIAGSLYGLVLVGSVLATLGPQERVGYMIAALGVTTLVFALAHAWAHALGGSARTRMPVDKHALRRSMRHEWTIVQAAVPASAALLPAALGFYSARTALWIALGVTVILLFIWGAALREIAGGSRGQVLGAGVASAALGLLLVVLKVLVH